MSTASDPAAKIYETQIVHHLKALSYCDVDFPYRSDLNASLTEEYAQFGHYYFQQQNYPEAIRLYLRARATDPNHFQVLYQLGKSFLAMGQYEDARDSFHEIIERVEHQYDHVHWLDAQIGIALSLILEGKESNLPKAEKHLHLIREAHPDHHDLRLLEERFIEQQQILHRLNQVKTAIQQKNWHQANQFLLEIKELSPHHHDAHRAQEELRQAISQAALTRYSSTMFNPRIHLRAEVLEQTWNEDFIKNLLEHQ